MSEAQPAERFSVLVLAADRGGADPVARASGVAHKYLAPVSGRPMLSWVLDALDASRYAGDVAVSLRDPSGLTAAPELQSRVAAGELLALPCAETPSLSVLAGIECLGQQRPLLITTGDHPLLTAEMVDRFCQEALARGGDLAVGLTAAETVEAAMQAFPDMTAKRTWLRFRDSRYSGSNLFAILTPRGLRAVRFWRRVEQDRKKPWRMIGAFGWGSLLLYLAGQMTLAQAMARASERLGLRATAIVLPFAEAAIDVDKPADLDLAERLLQRHSP